MRYASIRSMDISNGEGVGVSLFVQGCRFHCKNCFNQSTWDFNGGKEWTEETEDNFFRLINRTYIKRVSILGGEALADENVSEVLKICKKIRLLYGQQKTIWLYSGYTWEECHLLVKGISPECDEFNYKQKIRQEIIDLCDVLIDGRFVDELKDLSLKWRGSSNQRVINCNESVEHNEVVLWTK